MNQLSFIKSAVETDRVVYRVVEGEGGSGRMRKLEGECGRGERRSATAKGRRLSLALSRARKWRRTTVYEVYESREETSLRSILIKEFLFAFVPSNIFSYTIKQQYQFKKGWKMYYLFKHIFI